MILKLIVLLLFTASLAFGQSTRHRHRQRHKAGPSRPHSSAKTESTGLVRLTENLRAQGGTVALTRERVSQPFFPVAGRIININGEALQVFEYATPAAASAQATRVSADGTTIGTSKPTWMATPHFFKSGKLIVFYIGGNLTIVELLRTTLGSQFAGG